ncbi:MAG: glycosyltransferase family 4 protein [Opitutaceae bacterium]|nr:glycosyltransferase family 4 protein [Opitutaceae bacterium]
MIADGLRLDFAFGFHAIRGSARTPFAQRFLQQLKDRQMLCTRGPQVGMRHGGLLIGALSLIRAVSRHRPNLLHLHSEIPEAALAFGRMLSPTLRRTPTLRTIHNSSIWFFAPGLGRFCERRIRDCPCIAVSRAALEAVAAQRSAAGIPEGTASLSVVYNAVNVAEKTIPKGPNAALRMVYGGRFEPQKGVDLIPDIVRSIDLPAGMRVHLDLFGSGSLLAQLKALENAPPVGWTVRVHSPVPHLASRLCDYDVALAPSRFEGLPLFPLEALLTGLAVISTDAPGSREIFLDDYPLRAKAGDPVDFARKLQLFLGAPEFFFDSMREAKAEAEARFNRETMLEGYRSAYTNLLRGLPEARPA